MTEDRAKLEDRRAELIRRLAELQRPHREQQLRMGKVRPRNRAEGELFLQGLIPPRPADPDPDE